MTLKQAIKEADQVRVPVRIERDTTYHAIITKKEAKVIASDYLEENSSTGWCKATRATGSNFWLIYCHEIARFEIRPGTGVKILFLGK